MDQVNSVLLTKFLLGHFPFPFINHTYEFENIYDNANL